MMKSDPFRVDNIILMRTGGAATGYSIRPLRGREGWADGSQIHRGHPL